MSQSTATRYGWIAAGVAATIGFAPFNALAQEQGAKVVPLLAKDLSGIDGKEGLMLTVEYAPGASSTRHRHNAHTFVYVLEGSVVMQVDGGAPVTLGPGQTFYESPSDIHAVSKNASDSKPAKFVVFFVKDKGAPPVVPAR
jgi:quercetin dioxygenase-like cupin family protein